MSFVNLYDLIDVQIKMFFEKDNEVCGQIYRKKEVL